MILISAMHRLIQLVADDIVNLKIESVFLTNGWKVSTVHRCHGKVLRKSTGGIYMV